MSFSLNFPSADAPAIAPFPSGNPSPSGQPPASADPDLTASLRLKSFDTCLAQADQLKIPVAEDKSAPGEASLKKADDPQARNSDEKSLEKASSVVSIDQLAALLGLVGALPPPPAPLPLPKAALPSPADSSHILPNDPSGSDTEGPQAFMQTPGRFSGKNCPGALDSPPGQATKPVLTDEVAQNAVTPFPLQTATPPPPAAEASGAPANASGLKAMGGKSASLKDSVRELLASGVPLIEYSFGRDNKPVASIPLAFTSSAETRSSADFRATVDFVSPNATDQPQTDFSFAADGSHAARPPTAAPGAVPISVPGNLGSAELVSQSEVTLPTSPSGLPGADGSQAVAAPFNAAEQTAVKTVSNSSLLPANGQVGANIAVKGSREVTPSMSGVKSSNSKMKNEFQAAVGQDVTVSEGTVGTRGAKRVFSMLDDNPSSSAGAHLSDPFAALAAASLKSDNAFRTAEVIAPNLSDLTSRAAQTVREIRDIADGLWAVERNSVEVRFNFSETEKLSVRVEYRDGTVQATFRTDSPALRDRLASEWQAQASPSDSRPYRIAEPVFGSGQSPDANSQAQGFLFNDDSSRQQRSFEQGASRQSTSTFSFSRSAPSTTTAAPVAPRLLRPETTLHLNAFA